MGFMFLSLGPQGGPVPSRKHARVQSKEELTLLFTYTYKICDIGIWDKLSRPAERSSGWEFVSC